jgi:hypothetical protein
MDDRQEGRDPGRGRRAGSLWWGVFGFHQTHAGVGLVGPTGNPDLAGNSPLNLDIKTSLIRPSISPNLSVLISKRHRSDQKHTQED